MQRWIATWMALILFAVCGEAAADLQLVREGRALASVIVDPEAPKNPRFPGGDLQAAEVLVEWVRKITGASLPIRETPPEQGPAVYIGQAAVKAGLRLDDIESPSSEGLRLLSRDDQLLVGGQNDTATLKAVCRLLEELGCLYAFDHPLGQVHPVADSLAVAPLNITEKPGLQMRRVWGSSWSGLNLYKVWNGCGGVSLDKGHAWGGTVGSGYFQEHPEYFALRGGQRYNNQWLCTSNPELRGLFASRVIEKIRDGNRNPSLSPPDGRGHCQCPSCLAQDDPGSLEVGGIVSKSNRYVDFYDQVAREVKKVHPEAVLSFYAYADYTLPPTTGKPLGDNLCAWVAPIGYCWWHAMDNPRCASRQKVGPLYDEWARYVSKFAMRDYNYNFGDCILPFSKVATWRSDVPRMAKIGCIGIDMETLPNWCSYSPMVYVFSRLAYDPGADVDAMLENYFVKLYGADAGAHVQEYYRVIDQGVAELSCDPEGGGKSLEGLGKMYTPAMLKRLRGMLDQADKAAAGNPLQAERVAVVKEGLVNAEQYADIITALNAGEYRQALDVYQDLIARNEKLVAAGLANPYAVEYPTRFLGRGRELVQLAAKAAPNRVLTELGDAWQHRWDRQGGGLEAGYAADFGDAEWEAIQGVYTVRTSSGEYQNTSSWKFRWYRTRFAVPEKHDRIGLLLVTLHPQASVFLNGELVNGPADRPRGQWGVDFVADVTRAVKPGSNVLTIRRPHAAGTLVTRPVTVLNMPP